MKLSQIVFSYRRDCETRTSTVGATLGASFVESFTASDAPHCRSRAHGWRDANDMEHAEAYNALATALDSTWATWPVRGAL